MKLGVILCGLACAPPIVAAHDFWIRPATFQAAIGENVAVGLCEGDPFMGRLFPRSATRIEQFVTIGPTGEQPIVGLDGRQIAGVVRLSKPGAYVLAYRSKPSVTEIEGWRFEHYLHEKGLERIAKLRQERGTTHEKVRERYSRFAKAVVRVGPTSESAAPPIGFRLELLLESVPAVAAGHAEHSFRLLFDGKPLSGALVKATARGDPDRALEARTDRDGRVRYALRTSGEWLVTVVHMTRAGRSPEWESFWSSLTFEIPPGRNEVANRALARLCAA